MNDTFASDFYRCKDHAGLPPIAKERAIIRFATKTEADRYYMQMAFDVRTSSDDPKAKVVTQSGVGAVIVGPNGVISKSANVLPPAVAATMRASGRIVDDENRYFLIEHAERAAIFNATNQGHTVAGATLYCTRFPCSDCARAMIWAGIGSAVFATGLDREERWIDAQKAARQMLRDANISVLILDDDVT